MEPKPNGTSELRLTPGTFLAYANADVWQEFFDHEDKISPEGKLMRIYFHSVLIKEAETLASDLQNYDQMASGYYFGMRYSRLVQPFVQNGSARIQLLRTSVEARDAARMRLAEFISEEVAGYIPAIEFLYENGPPAKNYPQP